MRFKQALSRKLAAALSAVMILSTIAPTSVPVLAAAPDDVLVDSNVEYDLQDAGSEDVLLDSAESSLAEETDTLEVAGEELLAPETASDEVLVDSAEEVLSEETGIEPVETNDGIEVAEGATTVSDGTLRVFVTSENIIKQITFSYVSVDSIETFTQEIEAGKTVYDFPYVSANVEASESALADGYAALYVDGTTGLTAKATGSAADDYNNKFRLSVNGIAASNDSDTYNASKAVSVNLVPGDTATEATVVAKRTAYDGSIVLNTVSKNILNAVIYELDDNLDTSGTLTASANATKTIEFKNATKLTLTASSVIAAEAMPSSAYSLSANTKVLPTTGTTCQFDLKGGVNPAVTAEGKPNKDYDKEGNLTIKVSSQNTINGKIVSINQVKVLLGDYAIKMASDGTYISDPYKIDATASVNDIKTQDQVITVPYKYAKNATIIVTSDDGNNATFTKYAYTIDNEKSIFFRDGAFGSGIKTEASIDLGATGTAVELKPVQVSFDPTSNFSTVSAGMLDKFNVMVYDAAGTRITASEKEISAASDSQTKDNVEFPNAAKIRIQKDQFSWKSEGNGWAVRISYTDEEGKAVVKSIQSGDADDKGYDIPVSKAGTLPDIKVECVPYVKVTLSANSTGRDSNKKIYTSYSIEWFAENGQYGSDMSAGTLTNVSKSFYVEPEKVISINAAQLTTARQESFLFPYIVDATEMEVSSTKVWNIGAAAKNTDMTVYVDTKEFALKSSVVVGSVAGDGGEVTIAAYADAKDTDNEPSSTLSKNEVFDDNSNDLTVTLSTNRAAADMDYTLDKVVYEYINEYGNKIVSINKIGDMGSSAHKDLVIKADYVKNTLLKEGRLSMTVYTFGNAKEYGLTLAQEPGGSIKTISAVRDGEILASDFGTVSAKYGDDIVIKAAVNAGFKLVSVNIVEADKKDDISPTESENKVTNITDTKKLAEFTGKGYTHKMGKKTKITFTSEAEYAVDVVYKKYSATVEGKNDKYQVNHLRPVTVTYRNGSDPVAKFEYDMKIAGKAATVSDNEGVSLSGSTFTFDGTKGDLAGKTVVLTLRTGDGSKTDKSVKTVTLVFDKENTGIAFKKVPEAIALGSTVKIPGTVTGAIKAYAIVSSGSIVQYDEVRWDNDTKTLIVSTKRNSAVGKSVVNIVDYYDSSVIYGTVTLNITTDSVTGANKPVVTLAGQSNSTITLNLKANKIDTSIDGLAYKIKVTTVKQAASKGYFEDSKTVYVPVSEKSVTIDMASAKMLANEANMSDGDETAEFRIEAWMSQVKVALPKKQNTVADGDVVATSKDDDNGKTTIEGIKGLKGAVFETKLKLSKGTKGNIFTNMDGDNGFRINVVYSKNTQVQRISKYELYDKDGKELTTANYVDKESDYVLIVHPTRNGGSTANANDQLAAGNYTLKVWALEPNSIEVAATIKLKVVQGIVSLELSNAPAYIYKTGTKAAKAEVKAIDTTAGGKTVAKKNVEYAIVQKIGAMPWAGDGSDEDVPGFVKNKSITINKKSGKIAIKKDFMINNTKFYVRAKAVDYATTKCVYAYSNEITVKTTANPMTLAFSTDGTFDIDNLKDLTGSYTVDQLFGGRENADEKFAYYTYVTVYDRAEKTATAKNHYVPANIKVSGAGKLVETFMAANSDENGVKATVAKIGLNKAGKNAVIKISVIPTDGSTGRDIKNFPVTINTKGTLGYLFEDKNGTDIGSVDTTKAGTVVSVNNFSAQGDKIKLTVYGCYKDDEDNWAKTFINNTVTKNKGIKVAKVYKSGVNDVYELEPTARVATLAINNKDTNNSYTITINNWAIADNTVTKTATKVEPENQLYNASKGHDNGKGKIYSSLDFSGAEGGGYGVKYGSKGVSWNKVTYKITKGTVTKDSYALVSVVKDDTKTSTTGVLRDLIAAKADVTIDDNTFVFKLTGTSFDIDFIKADKTFNIKPGSYKITITPAEKKKVNGVDHYVANGKAATVNVGAVKAPKANVKPAATITSVTKNTATIAAGKYKNYIADAKVTFTKTLNINNKGTYNNFAKNFAIDGGTNTTGKLNFVGSTAIKPKENKNEFTGWVTYMYQNIDGTVAEENVKVTIKTTSEMSK